VWPEQELVQRELALEEPVLELARRLPELPQVLLQEPSKPGESVLGEG
jgi:hypothetical protein